MPLIMGAQRFAVSGGLAINTSALQASVSGSMMWANGQLGLFQQAAGVEEEEGGGAAAESAELGAQGLSNSSLFASSVRHVGATYAQLDDQVIMFAIVLGVFCALHFGLNLWWRSRCAPPPPSKDGSSDAAKESSTSSSSSSSSSAVDHQRKRTRHPLPRVLVWPCLPLLICKFFATGLAKSSVSALTVGDEEIDASAGVKALAAVVLVGLVSFFALSLLLLCRYYSMLRRERAWKSKPNPSSVTEVDDPLFRCLSRVVCCGAAIDRIRGEYDQGGHERAEPLRTTRLVETPVRCFHSNLSDAHDSIAVVWLARAHGGRFIGLSYDFVALLAQVAIAALIGIEDDPDSPSNYWPLSQAILIAVLQLGFSLYVLRFVLSIDRMENVITGFQFLLEGGATVLLLCAVIPQVTPDEAETLRLVSFLLAAISLFLPVLAKGYDGLLRPCLKAWRDKGSLWNVFLGVCTLIAGLPTLLGGVFGFDMGVYDVEGVMDEGAVVADDMAVATLAVAHSASSTSIVMAEPINSDAGQEQEQEQAFV